MKMRHLMALMYLLLSSLLIMNIFLIGSIPLPLTVVIGSNSAEDDSLSNSDRPGVQSNEFRSARTVTLTAFESPTFLSSIEEERVENATEETYISPVIPITNTSITLPNANKNFSGDAVSSDNASSSTTRSFMNNSSTSAPHISSDNASSSTTRSFMNNSSTSAPHIFRFSPLTDYPSAEPSVATDGNTFLLVGNHFASISKDKGTTWKYLNLAKVMEDYCCDQDVIYDPIHKLFMWYLQGDTNCDRENRAILGVSRDGLTWKFTEIRPTDLNATWKNRWFDYPSLALGESHIYITTNIVSAFADERSTAISCKWRGLTVPSAQPAFSTIVRIPLKQLSESIGEEPISIEYDYYYQNIGNNRFTFTPVQGAKNTMYWATHLENDKIRIYNWNESVSSDFVRFDDVTVKHPWTPIDPKKDPLSCPINNQIDSGSWCQKADSRISGGWFFDGVVGFLWNADAGNKTQHNFTITNSYIEGAMFNTTDDMNYLGRPYIWSNTFDWLYGYTTPNRDGDIGIVAVFGGGEYYPSVAVGVANNMSSYRETTRFWEMVPILCGQDTPRFDPNDVNDRDRKKIRWGDYLRLRSYGNESWIGTGFIDEMGTEDKKPSIFTFDKSVTSVLDNPYYLVDNCDVKK
jgi:hypothetical protein